MRIGLIAVALLGVYTNAVAADQTAYVTLTGGACTRPAKRMATAILQKAGVAVVWGRSETRDTAEARKWLRVELVDRTPDERLPGALAVAHPYSACSRGITVFVDRVRLQAGRVDRESALLAYVLVHEITHVIQGIYRHSEAGVMKAQWNADDRAAIFERRLGFLEEDVLLLRRGLEVGWCHQPGTIIGRYESEIADHPE
jgi:hypothetical protein